MFGTDNHNNNNNNNNHDHIIGTMSNIYPTTKPTSSVYTNRFVKKYTYIGNVGLGGGWTNIKKTTTLTRTKSV